MQYDNAVFEALQIIILFKRAAVIIQMNFPPYNYSVF